MNGIPVVLEHRAGVWIPTPSVSETPSCALYRHSDAGPCFLQAGAFRSGPLPSDNAGVGAFTSDLEVSRILTKPNEPFRADGHISPKAYIAVRISSAIQHLLNKEGSKAAGINKDENAPIFDVADYRIVCGLFEVVPLLPRQLEKRGTHKQY